MKFLFYGILVFIGLFLLIPCIIQISDSTGIGKKEGGFKVYDAYSSSAEGRQFIAKYKIKCVAKDVETIDFVDIKRGETFFAYNVDHHNYYFFENIRYDEVPDNIVKKYHLSPQFSWLDKNGRMIYDCSTWSIVSMSAIFGLFIFWPGKEKARASLKSALNWSNIKDTLKGIWEGLRDWLKEMKSIDYWLKD